MTAPYREFLEKTGIVKATDSSSEAAVKMSLVETAGRAALTATVTFAVGYLLKRMFEKSVEKAAAPPEPNVKPSSAAHTPSGSYKTPGRPLTTDNP